MKGYDQHNPHHDRDLLKHTLDTVLNIEKGNLPEYVWLELRTAALFHDIGKPVVAVEKAGKQVYYNHSLKSGEITEPLLKQAGFSGVELNHILFYIRQHEMFINYKLPEELADLKPENRAGFAPITAAKIRDCLCRYKNKTGNYLPSHIDWQCLMLLCIADVNAQADVASEPGKLPETKWNKIRRLEAIQDILSGEQK